MSTKDGGSLDVVEWLEQAKQTVSYKMIHRARDFFHDNHKATTEEVAHKLFEEFHDLAKRDHVSDDFLREMAMDHAAKVAELRAFALQKGLIKMTRPASEAVLAKSA